jgi:nitroreductase
MQRRSTVAKDLKEPGPSNEELALLLRLAARVPDHGKLGPWRFLIFQGEARQTFGAHLARVLSGQEPSADQARLDFERDRFLRAPTVVAVISKTTSHPKAPKWEQELSSAAVCQNMLIGASALGYAAQWLTEWYAYDEDVNEVLGLGEGERVAGYLYLGSTDARPQERRRPSLEERVSYWQTSPI